MRGEVRWEVDLRCLLAGRHYFRSEKEAKAFCSQQALQYQNFGIEAFRLSTDERTRILLWKDRLAKVGATMDQAITFFLDCYKEIEPKKLSEAIALCLESKSASGRRRRSCQQLGYSLANFLEKVSDKPCGAVTLKDVEDWLANGDWKLATKKTKLTDLRTLFSFCVKRRWMLSDPSTPIETILLEDKPPLILTVAQAQKLMNTALRVRPKAVPFFALALFCGIRPQEIFRLTRAEVDLEKGMIEIKSHKSKTRQRRIVTIPENCKEWLSLGGDIPPINWQRRFVRIIKASGIKPWPRNAMRHSFCSYSLPVHGAAMTALQAGHSETMLYRHYRELVTLDQAKAFWQIRPSK